ncbi:MAG: DNA pilot protein [Arizlama microvirus]|nr:MAG: DNA pilot protein [Arizlama microvirus]
MGLLDAVPIIGPAIEAWSANKQNNAQIASNEAINRANIAFQRKTNTQNFKRNLRAENRSRRDANHKIRTTVRDARKAGIHPLAALGSSAASVMGVPLHSDAVAPQAQQTHNNLGPSAGTYIAQGVSNLAGVYAPISPVEAAQIKVLESEAARNNTETALMAGRATSRTALFNYSNNPSGRSVTADGIPTNTNADVLEIGSSGRPITMDPKRPKLDPIMENYGSVVSEIAGAIQFIKDWQNTRQATNARAWQKLNDSVMRKVNPVIDGLAGQANAIGGTRSMDDISVSNQ